MLAGLGSSLDDLGRMHSQALQELAESSSSQDRPLRAPCCCWLPLAPIIFSGRPPLLCCTSQSLQGCIGTFLHFESPLQHLCCSSQRKCPCFQCTLINPDPPVQPGHPPYLQIHNLSPICRDPFATYRATVTDPGSKAWTSQGHLPTRMPNLSFTFPSYKMG